VELDKTVIRAGVSGRVEQFALRVGDIVNPLMRPAGVLIPEGAGRQSLQAGFGQIEAQVMKVGMVAEATCISKPWVVIPMVVTSVQDFIAAGQFRGGEQLLDAQQIARPGTILVFLEPLYTGGLDGVTPGSSCVANAYTSNHELLSSGTLGATKRFALHAVDTGIPSASCTPCCCASRLWCFRYRPSFYLDTEGVLGKGAQMANTAQAIGTSDTPERWWLYLLYGVAATLLGLLMLAAPAMTIVALMPFLGVYWLIVGILSLVRIFVDRSTPWVWSLIVGVLGTLAGMFVLRHPLLAAITVPTTLVIVLGAQGLIMGVVEIFGAFKGGGVGSFILGVINIVIGILLLSSPWSAALAVPFVFGLLLLVQGIILIIYAFRVKA
jgi:uncharacterized membrane protein HdeD (DUF308 family)